MIAPIFGRGEEDSESMLLCLRSYSYKVTESLGIFGTGVWWVLSTMLDIENVILKTIKRC